MTIIFYVIASYRSQSIYHPPEHISSPLKHKEDTMTHLSASSRLTPCNSLPLLWRRCQRTAMLIGVVRQAENTSAGRSGFIGNISLASHAPSWIHCLKEGGAGLEGALLPPLFPLCFLCGREKKSYS